MLGLTMQLCHKKSGECLEHWAALIFCLALSMALLGGESHAQVRLTVAPTAQAMIYPDTPNQPIDSIYYDFKSVWGAQGVTDIKAHQFFVEDQFNGIRTSIYGTRYNPKKKKPGKPAHPAPGIVIPEYYSNEIAWLKSALTLNPNLIIFASKKLNGKYSFPKWVFNSGTKNINPEKYAILLADYIEYMAGEGVPTHVLGIDNENHYNEANISPNIHYQVIEFLTLILEERNLPIPVFIGYEDYGPGLHKWVKKMAESDWLNTMNLYGTHYYPHDRKPRIVRRLESDLRHSKALPRWHSELHWNKRTDEIDITEVQDGFASLLDMTDRGFTGLMWWNYERSGLRGTIMRELTTHLLGYTPIMVSDHDGVDILQDGKLHTRAFKKGNKIVLWALNINPIASYADYRWSLGTGQLVGDVSMKQFACDPNSVSGTLVTNALLTSTDGLTFTADLPANTVTMFTLKFKEDVRLFNENFNKLTPQNLDGSGDLSAEQTWHYSAVGSAVAEHSKPIEQYFEKSFLKLVGEATFSSTSDYAVDVGTMPYVSLKAKFILDKLGQAGGKVVTESATGGGSSGYQLILNSSKASQPLLQVRLFTQTDERLIDLAPVGAQEEGIPFDVTVTLTPLATEQTHVSFNVYKNWMVWQQGEKTVDLALPIGSQLNIMSLKSSGDIAVQVDDIELLTKFIDKDGDGIADIFKPSSGVMVNAANSGTH